jgi:hypothetical protein
MVVGGFFILWSFWFNSLELTINNEMEGFFMLKVVMARGRKLKKSGYDLEIHKQNVVTSNQAIAEQNVGASNQAITEQNVVTSY